MTDNEGFPKTVKECAKEGHNGIVPDWDDLMALHFEDEKGEIALGDEFFFYMKCDGCGERLKFRCQVMTIVDAPIKKRYEYRCFHCNKLIEPNDHNIHNGECYCDACDDWNPIADCKKEVI